MDCLHYIQGIVVLDSAGGRIFAKYYTKGDVPESSKKFDSVEKQKQLEQNAFQAIKEAKSDASTMSDGDILIVDTHTLLFQQGEDVTFIVIGREEENELVLSVVLKTLTDSLREVLNVPNLYKRLILENYKGLILVVDEMIDGGIILETDRAKIVNEVEPHLKKYSSDVAYKAISTVNRYLRENM